MILNFLNLPLFFPFPILWAIGVAVAAIGGGVIFSRDPKKNKLGVLGMQAAGKTRFLSFLKDIKYIEKETSMEDYEPFTYEHAGKVISIDAGVDMGGGDLYRIEYNKIIENSTVIFYFFDISKYLNDNDITDKVNYRRGCNSRIEHIYSEATKRKIPMVFVGTHIDKCFKLEAKVKSEFLSLIEDKSYYSVLKKTEFIDLTNTNQLRDFINKNFK